MPASRHHQCRIDCGSGDGFGDKRISALIKRPSNAPRRLRGKQRDERRRFFGRRPRQKPVPSLVGVNKNDVDVLNRAQRTPARFDSESEQRALTNETIGSLAGAMQDHGALAKETERPFHETTLSCGCTLRGWAIVRLRIRYGSATAAGRDCRMAKSAPDIRPSKNGRMAWVVAG